MSKAILTTGPRIPDAFRTSLARYIREAADRSKEIFDTPRSQQAAQTLHVTAVHVDSLDIDDQRLVSLYLAQTYAGQPPGTKRGEYVPGPEQARRIAVFGQTGVLPNAEDFLRELVTAAIEDMHNGMTESHRQRTEEFRSKALQEARDRFEPATEAAQALEAEWRARVELLTGELGEAHKQIKLLSAVTESAEEVKEKAKGDRRRISLRGYTGVYATAAGLEIGWKEDGRQRWQALGDVTIEEAIAERESKLAEAGAPA